MSAFSTVISRLGDLSESELRQLYLVVGVRLGNPDGHKSGKTNQGASKSGTKTSSGKAGQKSKSSSNAGKNASKGNPQRKSQWETHPLYREYKRLKKVVETQAKESKTPFASVDTPERSAYNSALEAWLEAKSSFRDRGNTAENDEEESSSKGKGKAPVRSGGTSLPSRPSPTGKASAVDWAEDAQAAADAESSSEDEELPDAGDAELGNTMFHIPAPPFDNSSGGKPPGRGKPSPPQKGESSKRARK